MTIFFVTGNKDKFAEARAIVPDLKQFEADLPEIQSLIPQQIVDMKLDIACEYFFNSEIDVPVDETEVALVVEDISLKFHALGNLPGPLIKWFLEDLGVEGLYELTDKYQNYGAELVATLGMQKLNPRKSDYKYHPEFFRATITGEIVPPRGDKGYAWDAVFQPQGSKKTFAEMSPKEKQEFNPRVELFTQLVV